MIHFEERSKSSPENLSSLTNPLVSNIDVGNSIFGFKEATSQPDQLEFVENIIKEIGAHEDDQN